MASGSPSLQLVPLGQEGYILLDHGLSQGTRAPDLWIATSSHQEATEALALIEKRLVPGPEVGPWRLLTSARSLIHQFIANLVMDVWSSLNVPEVHQKQSQDTCATACRTEFSAAQSTHATPKQSLSGAPKARASRFFFSPLFRHRDRPPKASQKPVSPLTRALLQYLVNGLDDRSKKTIVRIAGRSPGATAAAARPSP